MTRTFKRNPGCRSSAKGDFSGSGKANNPIARSKSGRHSG